MNIATHLKSPIPAKIGKQTITYKTENTAPTTGVCYNKNKKRSIE